MAPQVPMSYSVEELCSGELSALFSNLENGCLKQYREVEAELFGMFGDYFEILSPCPKSLDAKSR